MATRTIKARVELDGEREYKQALTELNSGNRTLASEMKKLQAEYQGNSDSMEFMTKKGELLERQLLQQKEKVETLRQAVQKSAEQYGESDSRTQKWIQQLNHAEAAQFDLQHAIEANNAAMQDEGKTMLSLGDTVNKLAENFGVHLPDGLSKALAGMKGFSSGTVVALSVAAASVAAAIEGIKKLQEVTVEVAADVDGLLTESLVSGLSTELLQQLEYSENLIDVSLDTITGSLTKLTKNMDSARDGNAALAESFAALGVEITNQDGTLRSAEEVFFEVVDALGSIGNETERDAAAMELLGKNAQELAPIYKQGTDALRGYMSAANENYVLTEDQIAALAKLDDQIQQNNLEWEGLKRQIAAQFAPAATEALESFQELVTNAGKALIGSGIIEGVGEIYAQLAGMLKPVAELLGLVDSAEGRIRPVYEILHGLAGDLAWIKDTANATIGFLTYWNPAGREKWNTALGYNAQYGQFSNLQQWNGTAAAMSAAMSGYQEYGGMDMTGYGFDPATGLYYDKKSGNYIFGNNAGGNDNWRGGLTWVGETGPELVNLPAGSQILSAQESRGAGSIYIENFTASIDASSVREFNDIVELVRDYRVISRMG